MRIALVCPNYLPNRTYQENVWAEQLTRAGHVVRIISAGKSDEPVRRIEEPSGAYEEHFISTRFLPRSTFWSRQSHLALRQFRPDLFVLFGDKLFALPMIHDRDLAAVPMISTYSENLGMHEFDWLKPGISLRQRLSAVGFAMLRGGPIRAACRRSTLVVGNTPQAREIVLRLFPSGEREDISRKMIDMPLGFSPQHFGYFPNVRESIRKELNIGHEDVLVCVSSQFSPAKEPFVKLIIDALRQVMDHESSLRAIIVGFTDDPKNAAVSQRIREHIDQGLHGERFIKHPFAGRDRLCEIYNAADIAAFGRASISCQEALGTGLFGCFSDDGSTNHLVTRPDQGAFFRPNDVNDLALKLAEGVRVITRHQGSQREAFRQALADAAAWLGYDRIIVSILDQAAHRTKQTAGQKPLNR